MKKLLLLTVLLSSLTFGDDQLADTVCVNNQLHVVSEGVLYPVYDLDKTYQIAIVDQIMADDKVVTKNKIVDVFVVKECE